MYPVPQFVEGQTLLSQDVLIGNGVTETQHFRSSNLYTWNSRGHPEGQGPFQGSCSHDAKVPSWLITPGVWITLGEICVFLWVEKIARVFESEAIISVPIWGICSETDFSLRRFSHHTSVASVLRHWVFVPATDPHIKLLIRAFRLERPVQRRIMPKRDLHLVLSSLLILTFASECDIQKESSDDVIPLKWRTMKTVFLLALASVRWCVECCARQVCVHEREHPTSTRCISVVAGTWVPCEESTIVTGSGVDDLRSRIAHMNPTEAERMLFPVRQ